MRNDGRSCRRGLPVPAPIAVLRGGRPRQRRTLKFHAVAQRPHRAGGFTSGLPIAMDSEKSERDVRGESYCIPAYHERRSRGVVLRRRHARMGFQQGRFFLIWFDYIFLRWVAGSYPSVFLVQSRDGSVARIPVGGFGSAGFMKKRPSDVRSGDEIWGRSG